MCAECARTPSTSTNSWKIVWLALIKMLPGREYHDGSVFCVCCPKYWCVGIGSVRAVVQIAWEYESGNSICPCRLTIILI